MLSFKQAYVLLILLLWPVLYSGESVYAQTTSSGYSLALSTTAVTSGSTVTVTWRAPSTHSSTDWIGLFLVGLPTSGATTLSYKYVPAGTNGTLTFTAPSTSTSQLYEFRYLPNNGFQMTAKSNPITISKTAGQTVPSTSSPTSSSSTTPTSAVTAPPPAPLPPPPSSLPAAPSSTTYALSTSPASAVSGSSVTLLWKAPSNHLSTDWIGLFLVGLPSAGNSTIAWKYVPSGASGTMIFTAPKTLIGQTYEFRYLLNNGYTEVAKSNPLTVSKSAPIAPPPPPVTVTVAPPPPPPAPIVTAPPPPTVPPPATPTSSSTSDGCPDGKPIAFPGAEGFGRCAQGGRGGPVIEITNLNDDQFDPPVGSARHCLETMTGPRICRAAVSGWVNLAGWDIIVRNPYVTFEGVANGHRLGFKGSGIFVRTSHTIWRNATVLPGLAPLNASPPHNANGIFFWSDEQGGRTGDHIIDHSTVGYTSDDTYGVNAQRVTIQDSISGPAFNCGSINGVECGGKGIGLGASDLQVSVIRTLQVHTYIRFPEITSGKADFINSVSYNGHGTDAQINTVYGPIQVNFVGNVFLKGPRTYGHTPDSQPYNPYQSIRTKGDLQYSSVSQIHVRDNIGRCYMNGQLLLDTLCVPDAQIIWGDNGGITRAATFLGSGLSLGAPPMPASDTLAYVLDHVGPFPRSTFEEKVINEVRTRTGDWPVNEAAYGGWPTLNGLH